MRADRAYYDVQVGVWLVEGRDDGTRLHVYLVKSLDFFPVVCIAEPIYTRALHSQADAGEGDIG